MSTNATGTSAPPPEAVEPDPTVLPDEPKGKSAKTDAPPKPAKTDDKTAEEAQPKGRAPWEDDLYGRGLDDPRFHDYMRTVQQPYVTKIEQELAGVKQMFGDDPQGLEVASDLFSRLLADPEENPGVAADAIRHIVEALDLDPDELFPLDDPNAEYNQPPEGEPGEEGQPQEEDDPARQWAMQKMQEEQEARENEWYQGIVKNLGEGIPGFNEELWHTCVLATQGDLEAALDRYEKLAPQQEPKKPAPPTHGGGVGAPPPKEAKNYGSIDDAIDDFLDEDKASRR
jgi:hypothetical protein